VVDVALWVPLAVNVGVTVSVWDWVEVGVTVPVSLWVTDGVTVGVTVSVWD
jgi:hypothetical protein